MPRRLNSVPFLLAGLLLFVAGACSSADSVGGGAGETTSEASSTTTEPVESAPPSTEAPTTTVVEVDPAVAAVAGLPGASVAAINESGVDPLPLLPDDIALPIVFVHGFAGSAQQFESQAMRFVANGYPADRVVAFDHDGAGVDIAGYADGVDQLVDQVLADTGASQVYLIGHSRGTGVGSTYLADPARAAKVARYVAIDGAPCPDGDVPCLAPTQELILGQAHVEVATSAESFAMMYEFLVGEAPAVTAVEPQRSPIVISGRAVNFPSNTGRAGVTLDIWNIDPTTGQRVGDTPHATFVLDEEGGFGPVVLATGAHYEYLLSEAGSPSQHHLYLQPYVRSSQLARLLSSPADGDTRVNTNTTPDHSSIVLIRMREWYARDDADLDGDERDILEFSTDGGEAVNGIVEFVGNGTIGLHVHDDVATPSETTLAALPYFSEQPFQSGIDVFMPASPDGSGTITITNTPRGDATRTQTLNIPNWPSDTHAISAIFTDYPVD